MEGPWEMVFCPTKVEDYFRPFRCQQRLKKTSGRQQGTITITLCLAMDRTHGQTHKIAQAVLSGDGCLIFFYAFGRHGQINCVPVSRFMAENNFKEKR